MDLVTANIKLPEEVLSQAHIPKEYFDQECQKMVAMELYRKGHISLGKACEIGGMSEWEFFDLNKEVEAPVHYDEKDLEADRRLAREIFG